MSRKLANGVTFEDFALTMTQLQNGKRQWCVQWHYHCAKSSKKIEMCFFKAPNDTSKAECNNNAKHFATLFHDTNLSPVNQHRGTTCGIIWQGNPIGSVVKTVATKNCALCAEERIAILKQSRSNLQLLINSNNEIYGVCRHKPRFHKHAKQITPSTDESINDERTSPTHKVTTCFARCNVCLAGV